MSAQLDAGQVAASNKRMLIQQSVLIYSSQRTAFSLYSELQHLVLKCSVIRNWLRLSPFVNNGGKYVTQRCLVYIDSAAVLDLSFLISN